MDLFLKKFSDFVYINNNNQYLSWAYEAPLSVDKSLSPHPLPKKNTKEFQTLFVQSKKAQMLPATVIQFTL